MRLSVVIPAYGNIDKVLRCLMSLQQFASSQVEYIIQDDCSPEYDLHALIPQCAANTFRNEVNLGFPGNCNTGVANATGDVVFLVNQDCFAVPQWSINWDAPLLKAFEDHSDVAVVGARLLFPNGTIQSAGGFFDAKSQPFHRCLGYSDPLFHEVNTSEEVEWVTGGAFALRRDVWIRLGGFDTVYGRGYFEDVDYSMRAREAGYKVWYEPGCTFIHEVGSTGGNPQFHANAMTFHQRWVASGKIKPNTPAIRERFW